jgi:hypothetical protein
MLAHGSMLCPADVAAVLSLIPLASMAWAWLRWRWRKMSPRAGAGGHHGMHDASRRSESPAASAVGSAVSSPR